MQIIATYQSITNPQSLTGESEIAPEEQKELDAVKTVIDTIKFY
jgi:hypothetical protein